MGWLDSAEVVMREVGTNFHYGDLAEALIRENKVDSNSATPDITLHVSISQDIRRRESRGLPQRFTMNRGMVGLAEWDVGPWEEALATLNRTREAAKRDLMRRLRELSGEEFESYLEVLFTKMGYDVTVRGGGGDDGIDLIATLSGGVGQQRVGIQAKCLNARREIGPNPVRLLRDALVAHECNAGAIVATCRFNPDAIRVAQEVGRMQIDLIGPSKLPDLAADYRVGVDSVTTEAYSENLDSVFDQEELEEGS